MDTKIGQQNRERKKKWAKLLESSCRQSTRQTMITVYSLHIVCTNTLMVHIFLSFTSFSLIFTFWLRKKQTTQWFRFFSDTYFHFHISCSLCRDIYLCTCQQIIKNLLCSFQNTVYFFEIYKSAQCYHLFFLSLSVSTPSGGESWMRDESTTTVFFLWR